MGDIGKRLVEIKATMTKAAQVQKVPQQELSLAELETRIHLLESALLPFVAAYQWRADPILDSDLPDHQPRELFVTLGDCRRAQRILVGA